MADRLPTTAELDNRTDWEARYGVLRRHWRDAYISCCGNLGAGVDVNKMEHRRLRTNPVFTRIRPDFLESRGSGWVANSFCPSAH